MQIEIKSQGIAAFWRELVDNADVTSTVIAAGVAVFLSYGLWTIGRAVVRANRIIRSRLDRATKPKIFKPAETVAIDPVPMLARHWRRVDGYAMSTIKRAGEAQRSHEELRTLIDALDFEIAELMTEVAPISAYAAARMGIAPSRIPRPSHPRAPRRPIAA